MSEICVSQVRFTQQFSRPFVVFARKVHEVDARLSFGISMNPPALSETPRPEQRRAWPIANPSKCEETLPLELAIPVVFCRANT
jgi:hypothetical protein